MTLLNSVGLHATEDNRFNKSNADCNTDSNISQFITSQRLLIQRNLELTEENTKLKQLIQEKNTNSNHHENSNMQLLKDSASVFINVFFDLIVGVCVGSVIATALDKRNGRD